MLQLASLQSAPEPAPAPLDPEAIERARMLGEGQLRTLTRLAEIGLEMAAETARRVKDAPEDADVAGHAMAYSRIARAVRMTIALQSRVMKEMLALEQTRADGRRAADEAVVAAEEARVQARRDRIDRVLRRVVCAEHDDDETIARFGDDIWERLYDDDVCGDIFTRPIGEIVDRICQDLGLHPDWTRLAKEAWAAEEGFSPLGPQATAETGDPPPFALAPSAPPRELSG